MANIGQLFGLVLGAVLSSQKDSNVSVDSGMQLGQFFGRLAGSAAGQVAIPDDTIRAKYADALKSAGSAYEQLGRDRSQLGKQLGQKYNINLIDVFN